MCLSRMFIQLFAVMLVAFCYVVGGLATVAVLVVAAWLAFCPPRRLLDALERMSGGSVRFRFPELAPSPRPGTLRAVLTIDDCPSEHLRLIMDAIGNHKAYFGIIGSEVTGNPVTMQQLVASHHGLFNHDVFNRATALKSEAVIRHGLHTCALIVATKTDQKLEFFRPGCGLYTPTTLKVAKEFGYTTVLGDCYMHDCQLAWLPASWLAWMYRMRIAHGSVVILHGGTERQCSNAAIVIRSLIASGVQFVALP